MRRRTIDSFFAELDRELARPARVILTGAACGSLMGHIRPSLDVDFEIRPEGAGKRPLDPDALAAAVQKASRRTGLAAQYATDISRWSMIDYLDYRKTAVAYKTIGRLKIQLIAPAYWTIGKMARFLTSDIADMRKIIRSKRIPSVRLIRIWAKALRSSDPCLESRLFRDHVQAFLAQNSRRLWGSRSSADKNIALFRRLARIR